MIGLGLRARFVGVMGLVLAVLLGVTASLVVLRAERALLELDEARARALTHQLAEAVPYAVLARSEALLAAEVDAFMRAPDVVSLRVLDDEGAPIVARRGRGRGRAEIDVRVPVMTGSRDFDDGELDAFGLAAAEPREVGVLEARFSRAATRGVERGMRRDVLLAFALFGGLGLLLILGLSSSVTRRIRALADATSRVARGELDAETGVTGGDEIGALAADFGEMSRALARQRDQLAEQGAALAEKETLAAIGRATAVIAHELKNPLGIVLGAAEVLQSDARSAEQKREAAAIVVDEVQRLDGTLRELLDYARPKAPELCDIDICKIIELTAERATGAGGPAEGLRVAVEGDRPTARADERQARQILLNLLVNAHQAGAAAVTVRVEEAGESVRVRVSDDGPGVAADVRDELFSPFVTTKSRGAGLGLSASRRMARAAGGDLSLAPADPGGASFVWELRT